LGELEDHEAKSGPCSPCYFRPFLTVLTIIPALFLLKSHYNPVGRSYSRS